MKSIFTFTLVFFYFISIAQNSSFIKIIDNGSIGSEFIGEIYERQDSIYLFSSGKFNSESRTIIKLKSVAKNNGSTKEIFTDEEIQNISFDITSSVLLNSKYFLTGFHKTAAAVSANNHFLTGFENGKKLFSVILGEENISDISRGIAVDNVKDIIICGHVWKDNSEFDYDAFVTKLDTLGNTIWHTVIPARYSNLIAQSVTTDNENNIYVLADEDGFGLGIQHVTLIKLNPLGDTLWTKSYEGGSSIPSNILFNKRENLIASVTADFDGNGRGFTLMELDTKGNILWSKSYNDLLNFSPFSNDIIELKNGGYATALSVGHPVLMIFDEDGNVLKTKHFEEIEFNSIESLLELDDGSFVLAGNIYEFNVDIPKVMWLLKTDNNGDFTTSTAESFFPEFEIYPNPTADIVFVKNIDYTKIWVIDTMGKLVKSFAANQSINISGLPSGNYFFYFETSKGTLMKQMIKQ